MRNKIYRLEMLTREEDYEKLLGFLSVEAPFGWEERSLPTGETVFRVHCENGAYLQNMASNAAAICRNGKMDFAELENEDWSAAWRQFFTPVICGDRFVALPPWLAAENFDDRQKLIIEPKSAFGTGHHATTVLCLEAIGGLLARERIGKGQSFLDLGCGSGILSIACAKNGMSGLAVDIDELAIENAAENFALNGVQNVGLAIGSIEKAAGQKFNLIVANILAAPLMELAPQISAALLPQGNLVLSGILDIQADKVESAFCQCGLAEAERLADDEWRALIFAGRR